MIRAVALASVTALLLVGCGDDGGGGGSGGGSVLGDLGTQLEDFGRELESELESQPTP